ncbi:carbohydrate ABC transporter permease, partial [Enterococcus faecium]
AAVVPGTLACSLALPLLLNQKIRGMKLFRTIFFFPYVSSLVAIAVVWNMLFHPTVGPINIFLRGFIEHPPRWTSSSNWGLWAIVI